MPFHPRRSPHTRLLLAVAAAHVTALVLLQATGVWHDRGKPTPAREPLVVQLLAPPRAPLRPGGPTTLPAATPRTPAAIRPRERAADAIEVPAAAALPAPAAPQDEPAPAATMRPLVLDLPRKASAPLAERHPGLDDPRANSTRRTLESRIAAAVGSDKVVEEAPGNGRVRFRQGSGCVEVRPNSAGQLFPFNESVSPSNRLTTNC